MLKITVIGNITSDFELRTKPGDDIPYAIIRIASDRRYRDREGNKLTDFVSVKVRGNLAELCVEHLKKGDKIGSFDEKMIVEAGYRTVTPVVVTNSDAYASFTLQKTGDVQAGEAVLTVE